MIKILLTLFIFLITDFLFAQNWSVVNSVDKFNYRLDGDNIITATVWPDSVQVIAGDSVFFLNRIMCDTCATVIGGPNPCDTCYGLKNQPQFMQRKILAMVNGIVNFRDTGNIVIQTFALLNDSWLFDSTQNISATVIATGTDSIFGNQDSVKTILLSTGDTVKLSKSYGILQYPESYGQNSYYRLVGIEGRNLGTLVPMFTDFFNFNVGDMFEYHGFSSNLWGNCTGGNDQGCQWIRKYSIVSKSQNGDTVIYGTSGLSRKICQEINTPFPDPPCTTYAAISNSDIYIDSAGNWVNRYFNHQAIKLENIFPLGNLPQGNDSAFDFIKTRMDSDFRFTKYFGLENPDCQLNHWDCHYLFESEIHHLSDTLFVDPMVWLLPYAEAVKVGLGITLYTEGAGLGSGIGEVLMAYRKGNDTVGVFTPDMILSSVNEPGNLTEKIKLFPNPADKTVYITLPSKTETEISITDLQGKILIQKKINTDHDALDIHAISNGFYFLTLVTERFKFTGKIIIQH